MKYGFTLPGRGPLAKPETLVATTTTPKQAEIFLSENINSGTRLRFTDGSLYEVAPQDKSRAQFWLTPFLVQIESSGDPNYPYRITNTGTGVSVLAKQVEPPHS